MQPLRNADFIGPSRLRDAGFEWTYLKAISWSLSVLFLKIPAVHRLFIGTFKCKIWVQALSHIEPIGAPTSSELHKPAAGLILI
jgi:hypothetical protein